jgi:hypothetical protein
MDLSLERYLLVAGFVCSSAEYFSVLHGLFTWFHCKT